MTARKSRLLVQGLLIALLAIDLVAGALLLSPFLGGTAAQFAEADRIRGLWKEELRKAAPVKDIDKKIEDARTQVAAFEHDRLPSRDSAIAEELGKLVAENGVRFSGIRYSSDEQPIAGLRRMQIDTTLSGDYLKVVKFINALERDRMFFLVSSVGLGEQQSGGVNLELKLETYLRGPGRQPAAAPPPTAAPKTTPPAKTSPPTGKHA